MSQKVTWTEAVPLSSNKLIEADMIADSTIAGALRAAITALVSAIGTSLTERDSR